MCGRFFFKLNEDELVRLFEAELDSSTSSYLDEITRPRFNIAPTQRIVACVAVDGRRRLRAQRWGLIPSWAKDESFGAKTINARSETAHEKPAYRESFASRRCLIPASGFYEWKPGQSVKPKQPYAVRLGGTEEAGEPMVFAGLWSSWADPRTGTELETCSILTEAARGEIARMHHRMPVILESGWFGRFLDPRAERDEIRAMLSDEQRAERMGKRLSLMPVSKRVNRVGEDDRTLLERVEADEDGDGSDQLALF